MKHGNFSGYYNGDKHKDMDNSFSVFTSWYFIMQKHSKGFSLFVVPEEGFVHGST